MARANKIPRPRSVKEVRNFARPLGISQKPVKLILKICFHILAPSSWAIEIAIKRVIPIPMG